MTDEEKKLLEAGNPPQSKEEFAADKSANYPSAMPTTGQETVVATPETGQDQTTTTQDVNYLYPWETGMTMDQAYAQGKHSMRDIYMDRYRWGVANNNPVNVFEASMMLPSGHDIQKSKEQNETDIKKAERKEKFDKLGTFFMHLGNFVGATGFGGVDVKPEDPVKFTERQQRLKDKSDELRRAYNKEWFASAYKQQAEERAAEQAKAKAEADARNQDRKDREYQLRVRVQDWKEKHDRDVLDYNYERLRIEEDYKNKKISLEERNLLLKELDVWTRRQNANTASARESRMAQGTTRTTTKGGETTTVVTKPASGGSAPKTKKKVDY